MTTYEIKLDAELVSSLMSNGDAIAQLLSGVLNQVLEAQATDQIGAKPYERSEERGGYRNGVRTHNR